MDWREARDRNVTMATASRFVVYGAYLPLYRIDAGMVCWVLRTPGPEERSVECYFPSIDYVAKLPLRDFELGVARCLGPDDLLKPSKPVKPFKEAFKE